MPTTPTAAPNPTFMAAFVGCAPEELWLVELELPAELEMEALEIPKDEPLEVADVEVMVELAEDVLEDMLEELLSERMEVLDKALRREDGSGTPGEMPRGVASTFCAAEMKLVSKFSYKLLRLVGRRVSHDWVGTLMLEVRAPTLMPPCFPL